VPHRSFSGEPTPIHGQRRRAEPEGSLFLLVIDTELVTTYPLPDCGSFVIGRSEDADICVDSPLMSRRHALLHIASTIRIQDLNSSNGTCLHNRRLEPGDSGVLRPGDVLQLGSTMFVLQSTRARISPRRIWNRDYFQARVEAACANAELTNGRFAVIRVQVRERRARATAMHKLLLASLQPADIIARDDADSFQVLLIGPRADSAREVAASVARAASSESATVRAGVVVYPEDGRSSHALLTRLRCDLSAVAGPTKIRFIADAPKMKDVCQLLGRIAPMPINVLLLGETGVGKEVCAERIHEQSPRFASPLVRVNCASLPGPLLESLLFGHVRGAFTTAHADRAGLLESADGGSLFLDEIAEMPLGSQAKLLRFLDERLVRRVGSVEATPVDVRIVAATNRDLDEEVAAGRFRQDLFFRLNGISVVIPSLRHRRPDIVPLAQAFVRQVAMRFGRPEMTIGPAAMEALRAYSWPGNVRELRNVIERAIIVCDRVIERGHLSLRSVSDAVPAGATGNATPRPDVLSMVTNGRLRTLIVDALSECGGNQSKAARMLGISRGALIARIEQFGLPRPRGRRRPQRSTEKQIDDCDDS